MWKFILILITGLIIGFTFVSYAQTLTNEERQALIADIADHYDSVTTVSVDLQEASGSLQNDNAQMSQHQEKFDRAQQKLGTINALIGAAETKLSQDALAQNSTCGLAGDNCSENAGCCYPTCDASGKCL